MKAKTKSKPRARKKKAEVGGGERSWQEMMRLDDLLARHHPENPKDHDIGEIINGLIRFGYVRNVSINEADGKLLLGHGVTAALAKMMNDPDLVKKKPRRIGIDEDDGMWIVPTDRGSWLSKIEAKAYRAADNRLTEIGGWNEPQLVKNLIAVAKSKMGLTGTGFDERDVDLLIRLHGGAPVEDPGPRIDQAEELQKKWKVERGQVWEIGRHRLMCGDSTVEEDVERLTNGKKHGAVITDPPYGIEREGIRNDDPEGLSELYFGCLRTMPIENAIVIAFLSPATEWEWLDAIRKMGHKLERLFWMHRKAGKAFPWRGWVLAGDAIRISTVGKPEWGIPTEHNYDCYVKEQLESRSLDGFHSTIKPVDVVRDLMEHTTELVFDPFLGSGTTIVAAEQLNRICYGMEIEPKYCAVTLERMSEMGLKPKLISDDRTAE
jgi:hypothetical protein